MSHKCSNFTFDLPSVITVIYIFLCDDLLFYHKPLKIRCFEVQTFPSQLLNLMFKFAPRFMV